jgi:hypothetical protein
MTKIAESLPTYDLLRAYREASRTFNTPDIVLVVAKEDVQSFDAFPRSVYIEKALRHFSDFQRGAHPVVRESAHKKLQMPVEAPAFWLAFEMPDMGGVGYCAIGAYLRQTEPAAS